MEEKEENKQEELKPEEKIQDLEAEIQGRDEIIENLMFYSNQTNFNATLFKGVKLILEKLQKIEEKLGISENNG